jgi:uncharacterized protein with HEPN domain
VSPEREWTFRIRQIIDAIEKIARYTRGSDRADLPKIQNVATTTFTVPKQQEPPGVPG